MLKIECPQCGKLLSLRQRKGLLFQSSIRCTYCSSSLKVKEKARFFNSWFLGSILGITMSLFLKATLPVIIITVLLTVFFLQGLIDIFYSLEPENDEDLYL